MRGRSASPEGERGVHSGIEMMNDFGIGGSTGASDLQKKLEGARGRAQHLPRRRMILELVAVKVNLISKKNWRGFGQRLGFEIRLAMVDLIALYIYIYKCLGLT